MFLALLILLMACRAAYPQEDTLYLSLEEANELVVEEGNTYRMALFDEEIAGQELKEAYLSYLPKIEASLNGRYYLQRQATLVPADLFMAADSGNNSGGNGQGQSDLVPVRFGTDYEVLTSLNVNQPLIDLTLNNRVEIAQLQYELRQLSTQDTRGEARIAAVQSYYQVLINRERVQQQAYTIGRYSKNLAYTLDQVRLGLTNSIEAKRLEVSLLNAQTEKQKLLEAYELSKKQLKYRLGLPLDQPLFLTDSLPAAEAWEPEMPDTLYQEDVSSLVAYQRQQTQVQLQQARLEQERQRVWPTASLVGFLGYDAFGNTFAPFNEQKMPWFYSSFVGVQINWSLNRLYENTTITPRFALEVEQAREDLRDLENSLLYDLQNVQTNLRKARYELIQAKRNLSLAKEELAFYNARYLSELATAKELVDAEEAFARSQVDYLITIYNYKIKAYEWLNEIGRL